MGSVWTKQYWKQCEKCKWKICKMSSKFDEKLPLS